jgi:hypothetical protein
MKLLQLFTRIKGKTEVRNLANDKALQTAELEDDIQYFKAQLKLCGVRYQIAKAKQLH